MKYFIVLLLFFAGACTNNNDKTRHVADSVVMADSLGNSVQVIKDTFANIDALVATIRAKIQNNELTKKEGKMPGLFAYYNPDQTLAYIYSNESGEYGRVETESFFINNELQYCQYRDYYFLPDSKNKIRKKTGTLKAEKVFYLPEDPLAKDSITVYNEDVKFAKKEYVYSREDMPTEIEIAIRMLELKNNF
ncbi:MAG: hypothetical protein ABIQ40_19150 [Bacteroidia bacterium]